MIGRRTMPAEDSPSPHDVRGLGQRGLEAAAITVCALLWSWLAAEVASALPQSSLGLLLLAPATVLGLATADLVSGLVHFTCDAFFGERTPLIGPTFIAPFRDHHRDPRGIARHGFLECNGNNGLATLPVLSGALALRDELGAVALIYVLTLTLALAATNQVHAWAHAERAPTIVEWLQSAGLVLSPAMHAAHHAGTHDRAYCITTGWLNPWLDRSRAFAHLERRVRAFTRSGGQAL